MICESEGKKTISNEHLFKALTVPNCNMLGAKNGSNYPPSIENRPKHQNQKSKEARSKAVGPKKYRSRKL